MSADAINTHKHESAPNPFHNTAINTNVCVLVGHSIEAITSAVVLASLGHVVHLYADKDILAQQLQQYGFEHHLQALWQMYDQQQQIISYVLPKSADELIQRYEVANDNDEKKSVGLYWLF